MSQTFFVWPHGGKSVSIASDFNHWTAQPLVKQGNYFFIVLDIPDGTYEYKFVVDGRWVYDISQPHQDDGSGNWNNYVEVGKAAQHHAPAAAQSAAPKHEQKGKQQNQQPQQKKEQQPKKEQQQKGKQQQPAKAEEPEQQQESKKKQQPAKAEEPEQHQESKKKQQQKGKQQQPAKAAEPEPEPQPEPEPEPEPQNEEVAEEAPAPAVQEEKKEKVLQSIITLEVVGSDVDTDMEAVEKWVRSVQRPGLKWEGSAVKEHVFAGGRESNDQESSYGGDTSSEPNVNNERPSTGSDGANFDTDPESAQFSSDGAGGANSADISDEVGA